MTKWVGFCFIFLSLNSGAIAEPLQGHVKLQQQYTHSNNAGLFSSLGEADVWATTLDLRLKGRYTRGASEIVADYYLDGAWGNAVRLQNQLAAIFASLGDQTNDAV